jgi:hypothetical protein
MIGILKEERLSETRTKWTACNNFNDKKLYLTMDGLSLDRHRSFKKKLMKIPQSYSDNFRQSIEFEKALSCVIETSGPLHIAFHILQTIYTIFDLLLECAITVVGWKKIKVTKVSDCFQSAKGLAFLLLEELERYLVDVMIQEMDNDTKKEVMQQKDSDEFPILMAQCFIDFLSDSKWKDTHPIRLYLVNYCVLCRKFRLFWNSIRSGDRLTQEFILNEWIGIFSMLNKKNYLEIALNTIDRNYSEIAYEDLEECRLNSFVRYNKGIDKDGRNFYCVALDEAQEIFNSWTKKMPLGTDEDSWVKNSKNLMFVRQCINYEEHQYKKRHLHYNDDEVGIVAKNGDKLDHVRTTEPSITREKIRMYEWIINLLQSDANVGQPITRNVLMNAMKNLTSSLTYNISNNDILEQHDNSDHLNRCIDEMFGNIGVQEDEDQSEVITSTNDEFVDEEEEEIQTQNQTNVSNVHKISLFEDILYESVKHLESKNLLNERNRKKQRLKRYRSFFIEVNESVQKLTSTLSLTAPVNNEFHESTDVQPELSFRERYNRMHY